MYLIPKASWANSQSYAVYVQNIRQLGCLIRCLFLGPIFLTHSRAMLAVLHSQYPVEVNFALLNNPLVCFINCQFVLYLVQTILSANSCGFWFEFTIHNNYCGSKTSLKGLCTPLSDLIGQYSHLHHSPVMSEGICLCSGFSYLNSTNSDATV